MDIVVQAEFDDAGEKEIMSEFQFQGIRFDIIYNLIMNEL